MRKAFNLFALNYFLRDPNVIRFSIEATVKVMERGIEICCVCIVNIKGMDIDYVFDSKEESERAASCCCHNDVHGKYVKKIFFFLTITSEIMAYSKPESEHNMWR